MSRGTGRRVAAVVPTLVRSRPELDRAVRSILAQTVQVAEVVVVVDREMPAAELPVWDDPRVRVVVNTGPHGPGAARAAGVEASGADLIAWLDDDDEWTPERVERQLAVLGDRDDVVVAGRALLQGDGGARLVPDRPPRSGERIEDFLFPAPRWVSSPAHSICTPTLLIPREVLRRVPVEKEGRRWEDYAWLLTALRSGVGLIVVPETCALVDQGRSSGLSASSVSDPDVDMRWADLHLAQARSARDVFVLTYVAPGLATRQRWREWRREMAAAIGHGAAPALVVKSVLLASRSAPGGGAVEGLQAMIRRGRRLVSGNAAHHGRGGTVS